MEQSYGKLFQELGYTFLNQSMEKHSIGNSNVDDDDEDDSITYEPGFKSFNGRKSSTLDDLLEAPSSATTSPESQSQLDKIRASLYELRLRINVMRKKYRLLARKTKLTSLTAASAAATSKPTSRSASATSSLNGRRIEAYEDDEEVDANTATEDIEDEKLGEDDEQEEADEATVETFKLCVFVKDKSKLLTFRVQRNCRVKELKKILYEKIVDKDQHTYDDMILMFKGVELMNETQTLDDYGITKKCTVSLEFDEN